MNNALIFGGGSKLGLELSFLLSNHYQVTSITQSQFNAPNVKIEKINWSKFALRELDRVIYQTLTSDRNLDLIVFNQNSKAGPNNPDFFNPKLLTCLYKNWIEGYRTDCMIPYYVIHKLTARIHAGTKVCWMFSSLINDYIATDIDRHASYRGMKLTNYFIMQAFSQSHPGIFFGVDPGHTTRENRKIKAPKIVNFIQSADANTSSKIYNIDKEEYWLPLVPPSGTSPI